MYKLAGEGMGEKCMWGDEKSESAALSSRSSDCKLGPTAEEAQKENKNAEEGVVWPGETESELRRRWMLNFKLMGGGGPL